MNDTNPASILIVKTSAIGDVIQTFGVLEYLRQRYPEARIDWIVEEGIAPLLKAHPQVDHVLEIKSKVWRKNPLAAQTRAEIGAFRKRLKETKYDVLFDLQGNAKSAVVTSMAKAGAKVGFGWTSVREKCNLLVTTHRFNFAPGINIRSKYLGLVQSYFGDDSVFEQSGVLLDLSSEEAERLSGLKMDHTPKIMVCFGSKWPNKRLEISTLRGLLEKIAEDSNPYYTFIYGDAEEKLIAEQLSAHFNNRSTAVGQLSLPLWQALMWEMDGVIAADSAALHLCGTTNTPSLSVFGPSMASYYSPPGERHHAVQGACPYGKTFSSRCPILRSCSTGACMKGHQADALFDAYKVWAKRWDKANM